MSGYRPEVLLDGIVFPEGPRWRDGELYFSDMLAGRVIALSPDGSTRTVCEVEQRPSGLGWLPGGDLLVVSMRDRKLLRLGSDGLSEHADLSSLATAQTNDMVVDTLGRAYVGHFGFDFEAGEEFRAASLVLVTPDGKARIVAEDLAFPNGTVISPDGRRLILAESYGSRLTAFDIESDGSLSGRRPFADLGERTPDGICGDAGGAIWASCFGQDEFVRVLEGGEITDRIDVSGRRAVACVLGGEDRRTLFLLTAETSLEELAEDRSVGYIETVRVEIPGAGTP